MTTVINAEPEFKLAKITPVEQTVIELVKRYDGVVYDVTTTKGMAAARSDRAALRTARVNLEAARKEEKADVLRLGKFIDSEAKRIGDVIAKYEDPLADLIKAEEDRKEAEKAEKLRIEQERINGIRAKIQTIREYPLKALNVTASKLEEVLPGVEALTIDKETYQEFQAEAQAAKDESLCKLRQILTEKQAAEAEAARIKAEQEAEAARLKAAKEEADRKAAEEQKKIEAERAELDRLRKEDEARRQEEDRKLREAREAEEAKLKAERDAEEKRIADERAEMEAEAAAKQAEIDRQQRELEEARATAEAEEKARQEAEAKRIAEEKVKAERMITCPACGHTFDREESAAKEAA